MVEFLLRLFCIIPIDLLLTRIGYNFTNINVAAFITDCGGNKSFFVAISLTVWSIHRRWASYPDRCLLQAFREDYDVITSRIFEMQKPVVQIPEDANSNSARDNNFVLTFFSLQCQIDVNLIFYISKDSSKNFYVFST